MNTTSSPFSFLQSLATRLQPPAWVVDETQQRLVLFLNHVLMQEKEAQNRLARKKGSVLHVRWGVFAMDVVITPAGLLDRAQPTAKPDLLVSVAAESPFTIVQSALAGKAPPVKIEGDVQLAAELGWLKTCAGMLRKTCRVCWVTYLRMRWLMPGAVYWLD